MSAADFTKKIDSPGAHDFTGFITDGAKRYFCDLLAERSDVVVTTKAVEWATTRYRSASSPEARVGYVILIGGGDHPPAVYLQTTSRAEVREIHHEVVRLARERGESAAVAEVQDIAFVRGIRTNYLGTVGLRAGVSH